MESAYIDNWCNNLEKLKNYIDKNQRTPSSRDNNFKTKQISSWFSFQKRYYKKWILVKNNFKLWKYPMKDDYIRSYWEKFTIDYEKYLDHNMQKWYNNLNELKKYLDLHGSKPKSSATDLKSRKLYVWLQYQYKNYCFKSKVMKNEKIREDWQKFVKQYDSILLKSKYYRQQKILKTYNEYVIKKFESSNNDINKYIDSFLNL